MFGTDVLELQQYLNNNGYPVAATSFGSLGQETTYFGELTKNALTKLQMVNNIPATIGVFDSVTKSFRLRYTCSNPDPRPKARHGGKRCSRTPKVFK